MRDLLIGAACGTIATLAAVSLLFGAQTSMISASDSFGTSGAYYVVGKKPFDYFFRKPGSSNCWGGHTLDGRCISLVVSSGPIETWTRNTEAKFRAPCPKGYAEYGIGGDSNPLKCRPIKH